MLVPPSVPATLAWPWRGGIGVSTNGADDAEPRRLAYRTSDTASRNDDGPEHGVTGPLSRAARDDCVGRRGLGGSTPTEQAARPVWRTSASYPATPYGSTLDVARRNLR